MAGAARGPGQHPAAPPPSAYVRRFYYDSLIHSEAALRLMIDTAGADRVVFGTDWPADLGLGLARLLAAGPRKPDPGGEGAYPLEEPGEAAGDLVPDGLAESLLCGDPATSHQPHTGDLRPHELECTPQRPLEVGEVITLQHVVKPVAERDVRLLDPMSDAGVRDAGLDLFAVADH